MLAHIDDNKVITRLSGNDLATINRTFKSFTGIFNIMHNIEKKIVKEFGKKIIHIHLQVVISKDYFIDSTARTALVG